MSAVRGEVTDRIATLTLTDVDNRNALSGAVVGGLIDGLAAANADSSVRAVVVTNEGNVFCAGADLKHQSSAQGSEPDAAKRSSGFDELVRAIMGSPTPVLGRIDGHAVGGGVGLAAACDISIARTDAKFGFTEVRVGAAPAIISVICLPKMRRGDALEAFLRGNRFSASRAAELGLINQAVPADDLDAAVRDVLDDIMMGGPNALSVAKRLVYEVPTMDPREGLDWTTEVSASLFAGNEAAEGMAAFLEKRRPPWVPGQRG